MKKNTKVIVTEFTFDGDNMNHSGNKNNTFSFHKN